MEMTGKVHIPTTQFGYIEKEYSFVGGSEDDFNKKMVDDFNLISGLFKSSVETKKKPMCLGQKMTENGHTYVAVKNEAKDELYWIIEKV